MEDSSRYPILSRIGSPRDLRLLETRELADLAGEIRELILETTCLTGGHLASSLGTVELSIALHRVLDTPKDRIVWDVGHQAYAHKIITGRRDSFHTLRQYGGISGFPRRCESEFDVVDSGHAGSSLSYGLGLALARDLRGEDYTVAVVVGDGALGSGVAFEAMNQAGHHLNSNLIIILNDNEMSISKNVGGISAYLSRMRIEPGYTHLKETIQQILKSFPAVGDEMLRIASRFKNTLAHALVPGAVFEALGLKYVGPIDGHDIPLMEKTIVQAREIKGPVMIHVVTEKGKGYRYAENRPEKFHGISAFDRGTGAPLVRSQGRTYTEIFGDTVVQLARENPRLVAITAAMKLGTGLDLFSRLFPERFFDVGIAEQLAVNLGAGLALGGLRPVVAIYSTFLQRAFDQLSQEVCLQKLPVVLAIDRAGLVGEDGATHHGYFDLSYLRMLPNIVVLSPATGSELSLMLRYAFDLKCPVAIRFPRREAPEIRGVGETPIETGSGEVVVEGGDVCIIGLGDMLNTALQVGEMLGSSGLSASVVNARFAKPLSEDFLRRVAEGRRLVATVEENVRTGGFGSAVADGLASVLPGIRVLRFGLPDRYVEHGEVDRLLEEIGIIPERIAGEIEKHLR